MKEDISKEQIEEAFSKVYWGECLYGKDNRLSPQGTAIWMVATNLARNLLRSRFPAVSRNPACRPFNQDTMMDMLRGRGFAVNLFENQKGCGIRATKGFHFRFEKRRGGFYVDVGGWLSQGSYTAGEIEEVADWVDSIAEKYWEIMDYVKAQYNLEQQKTLVDGLLGAAAQAYLPEGLRCEVWHERYLNYIKVTRRMIGILSNGQTIGDTVLEDESDLQGAVGRLLRNEEVQRFMKDRGLPLQDSGR